MVVKFSATPEYLREGYMKLDISAVQPGDTVKLQLFGHLSDTRAASVTTNVFPVASTSWPETGLNYNNRPASGTTAIGSINVSGTTGQWYEVDLTPYAQAQRSAGATQISIALKGNADTLPYATFSTRESGVHPKLVIAAGQGSSNESRILADTYARSGSSSGTSFGAASEVVVKFSADAQYLREGYMLLDISDVQPGDTVTLRLFGRLSDAREAAVTAHAFPVADTTWSETGLNWNNRPASGSTAIASVAVAGTTGQWYNIDLTSYAQSQRSAGKTKISISLKGEADTLPYVTFSSSESSAQPQLLI
jgi:hypothetical protein